MKPTARKPNHKLLIWAHAACLLIFGALTANAQTVPVPEQSPRGQSNDQNAEQPAKMIEKDVPESGTTTIAVDIAAAKACRQQLKDLGVAFNALSLIDDSNGCIVPIPVEVSSLADDLKVNPSIILSCSAALALGNWTNKVLIPSAESAFPANRLTEIRQSSGYVCRRRNNMPGGKLSEHATGNAIDIAGFGFKDGTYLEVKPRQRSGTMEEAFQKAVRFGACTHFTTVLGPFSDANHADHLHFDLAQRRRGHRLCQFPEALEKRTD